MELKKAVVLKLVLRDPHTAHILLSPSVFFFYFVRETVTVFFLMHGLQITNIPEN